MCLWCLFIIADFLFRILVIGSIFTCSIFHKHIFFNFQVNRGGFLLGQVNMFVQLIYLKKPWNCGMVLKEVFFVFWLYGTKVCEHKLTNSSLRWQKIKKLEQAKIKDLLGKNWECFCIQIWLAITFCSPDDWECFLHYLGCLLEDASNMCLGADGNPVYPPKPIDCRNLKLTDKQVRVYFSFVSVL